MNRGWRSILLGAFSLLFLWTATSVAEETATEAKPAVVKKKKHRSAKKASAAKKNSAPAAAAPANTTPAPASESAAVKTGRSWFKDLKDKLNRNQARQSQIVAVAAVRGDESSAAAPLYWKGKNGEASNVMAPEASRFQEGVDAALSGDDAAAREKFTYFVTTYPQSPLKADADEALRRLSEAK